MIRDSVVFRSAGKEILSGDLEPSGWDVEV